MREEEKELNKYVSQLLEENVIEKQLYWRLQSTTSLVATMYGQPKVHTSNCPLRPIISSLGSHNHELARYLADTIKANRPSKSFSFTKDSFEFVHTIKTIKQIK